jgi:hypothetical protein
MTTRGQIVDRAFSAIGISDWSFSLSPEEQASAWGALDSMMLSPPWCWLGYTAGGDEPNRSDLMTTPTYADEAISANLALRLAPASGKTVPGEHRKTARAALNVVTAETLCIPQDVRVPVRVRQAGRCR